MNLSAKISVAWPGAFRSIGRTKIKRRSHYKSVTQPVEMVQRIDEHNKIKSNTASINDW